MEVALTFGSLGDIIQLCQLAIQLGRAVGVGCGAVGESAKEYQELRHDLGLFVRILTQAVATYEEHESGTYLADLDKASKSVVDQTASLIQDALDHFQSRYKNSLHPEGSGKKRSARVDNTTLLARVAGVQTLVSRSCSDQEEMLDLMRQQRKTTEEQVQKLDEVSQQLVKQDTSSRNILAVAGEALSAIIQVKDLLFQVSQDVINVRTVLNSMFTRSMDPTKELPVTIEDALGRHVPIPPEWLDSLDWEKLYLLICWRFEGENGYEMVMRRDYALEESASGRDLDLNRPLHLCLRRGMKINMTMIFQIPKSLSGACPRCMTEIDAPEDITVQCPRSDCGMWFSMRQTVMDDSNQTTSPKDDKFDKESAPTVVTILGILAL
ncbi:hypothetical protein CEP51_013081 [Fusarium floridanum]|uniref:Ubiquitin-like domain-containing protein n=1 Tax=Fusarium floridanum TaxID=1325733 RepID=A0A428QHT5_9HYPO|nr:hypothetical protein CEP51_013081 [Fusarium floridanum]